jgi:hypothetical protein
MGDRAAEFRALAAECLSLAGGAADPDARARLVAMAQRWHDLANERSEFDSVIADFNDRQTKRR